MRSKYDDEALSRILGEHAAGNMRWGGANNWRRGNAFGAGSEMGMGCVNQVAFNEPGQAEAATCCGASAIRVWYWFDRNYEPDMSPEELLAAIVEAS